MNYSLVLVYLSIVVLKIIISFFYQSPFILVDEIIYFISAKKMALEFFLTPHKTYPPLYTFLIMPLAMIKNVNLSYHLILILNSFLMSSSFFFIYYLSKHFVNRRFAIYLGIISCMLPAQFPLSFVMMSENIYIPLFLLVMTLYWSVLQRGKEYLKWSYFSLGSLIGLMFMARSQGIVMILAWGAIFVVTLFMKERNERWQSVKEFFFSFVGIFMTAGIPYIIKIFTLQNHSKTMLVGYNTNEYVDVLTSSVFSLQFYKLILNEVSYLFISSFLLFFVFYALSLKDIRKHKEFFRFNTLFIIYGFGTIIVTVVHMYKKLAIEDHVHYYVFGRYLDSLQPMIIFLGGIWFLNRIKTMKDFLPSVFISSFFIFASCFILLNTYKIPNSFGLLYLMTFKGSYIAFILSAFFFFGVMSYLYLKNRDMMFACLLFLISFSNIRVLKETIAISSAFGNSEQLGKWIVKKGIQDSKIYYDAGFYNVITHSFLKFWSGNNTIRITDIHVDTMKKLIDEKQRWLVSREQLPYRKIYRDKNNNFLYDLSAKGTSDELFPFSLFVSDPQVEIEGMFTAEPNHFRWTSDHSKIKIKNLQSEKDIQMTLSMSGYRPEDNPATVQLYMNGKFLSTIEKKKGVLISSVTIPKEYLQTSHEHVLSIITNTWSPSESNKGDLRQLGIQIDKIRFEEIY